MSNFPPELVGHVLNWEDASFLCVRLWLCGSTRLNTKLSACITTMNLASHWSLQFGLPSALYSLRSLRSLTLKSAGKLMRSPVEWSLALAKLPETLTSLDIASLDSSESLLNHGPGWTPTLPLTQPAQFSLGKSQFIDLAARFPHLLTLKLSEPFCSTKLPALPPNLTFLRAAFLKPQNGAPQKILSLLPRSLRFLDATLEYPKVAFELEDWANAPPQLESIRELILDENQDANDYSWIPRSIRAFHVVTKEERFCNISGISTLPPLLEVLEVSANQETMLPEGSSPGRFSHLPPCLTDLTLRADFESRGLGFSDREIRTLPRHLKKLLLITDLFDFRSAEELGPLGSSLWPSQLTHFEMALPMLVTHLRLLPPTITTLKVSLTEQAPSLLGKPTPFVIRSSSLPSALTDLNLVVVPGVKEIEFSGKLPTGITKLIVTNHNDVTRALTSTTVRFSLPPRLIILQATLSPASRIEDISNTLKSITHLTCAAFQANHLKLLLNSLTTFIVNFLALPPESGLEWPSSLTDLRIAGCPHETRSFVALSHLTRLRHLELPSQLTLQSIMMRHLPRSLKYVKMHLEDVDDNDVPFMPPFLEDAAIFWGPSFPLVSNFGRFWPLALTRSVPRHAEVEIKERRESIGADP